jgi:tetratricopeptide (TPR) repeat protein
MWLQADRPALAKPELDRFLAIQPHHANARLTRSRILARLGEPLAASHDLAIAMAQLDRPTPELYLEQTRLLVTSGDDYAEAGLENLAQGIARLGPVVSLIECALESEISLGRYEEALARFDLLPTSLTMQPGWLQRRGDLLLAAGRVDDAQRIYRRTLNAILMLPPARRQSQSIQALQTALQQVLTAPHASNVPVTDNALSPW